MIDCRTADEHLSPEGEIDVALVRNKGLAKLRGVQGVPARLSADAIAVYETVAELQLAGGWEYSEIWIPDVANGMGLSSTEIYAALAHLRAMKLVDLYWAPGTYTENGDFRLAPFVSKKDAEMLKIGMCGGAVGYVRFRNDHPLRTHRSVDLPTWKSVADSAYKARWGAFKKPEGNARDKRIRELLAAGAPLVVSWGIGRDSTAILIEFARQGIRPDAILYAEVGCEKPETYAYRPYFENFLRKASFPRVQTVKKIVSHEGYCTLEEELHYYGNFPSIAYGYQNRRCSSKWKVEPQENWCKAWPVAHEAWRQGLPIVRAIGFDDSPEEHGRSKREQQNTQFVNWFPLQEWHWDLDRVIAEIKREKVEVPVKSACFFCSASQPEEVDWIAEVHPEYVQRIRDIETSGMIRAKGALGLWFKPRKKQGRPASWSEYLGYPAPKKPSNKP
jgi:3'-phosphoadenosine 5'-phosphosulfate sulfotransferase (PAPS reductase)/FAD synthetase